MTTKSLSLLTLFTLSLATPLSYAQKSTWAIDPAHSVAEFQIRHLGVSNVRGSITGIKGTVNLDEKDVTHSDVSATLETSTVTTSNEKRDTHLKSAEFFDVSKNPQIAFKSTRFSNSGGKLQMTGDLTIGGVTKSVTLDVDGPAAPQTQKNGKVVSGISASGMLKRSDFNFGPKWTPPAIGDDVKFTIDLEIDKQ
jgi:polyisoprenoid-binding protein YceI